MPNSSGYSARLQQKVKDTSVINLETDCWMWLGQISNSGRGRINIRDIESQSNKIVSAETASYIAFFGKISTGKLVRQKCGVRTCVNPHHLELVKM